MLYLMNSCFVVCIELGVVCTSSVRVLVFVVSGKSAKVRVSFIQARKIDFGFIIVFLCFRFEYKACLKIMMIASVIASKLWSCVDGLNLNCISCMMMCIKKFAWILVCLELWHCI